MGSICVSTSTTASNINAISLSIRILVKQYSHHLRSWWNFCRCHRASLYTPSVSQFLKFLAEQLPNINSYSSLNTMRSAISLISQNEIGNHSMIRRFCKGIAALKPPRAHYEFIWDPAPVITKLASIYPYDSSILEVLTKKLMLLLALASGHHAQTLSLIRISQISLGQKLIIRISDRIKISAPGHSQPFFCFPRFANHDSLFIVRLLEHYY